MSKDTVSITAVPNTNEIVVSTDDDEGDDA